MARWEPNAVGRLQDAALELFRERGYDATTVTDIAARAGLTRRTFFRYFTDKRGVLFFGAEKLDAFLAEKIREAPASMPAIEAIALALDAMAGASDKRPGFATFARQRQALIETCAELRERDLIKLASLGSALAQALRLRGMTEPEAYLAGEAGIAAFKVAFVRWAGDRRRRSLRHHLREAMDELKALASGQVSVAGGATREKVAVEPSRGTPLHPPAGTGSRSRS